MDPIQRYFDLLHRIDAQARRLAICHGADITCRPGCTSCCVNLTVFPVEFHAIRTAMAQAGVRPELLPFDEAAACGFLDDGLCRIYPYRPIICRTHGLPILYVDDSSGESVWEVSFCELNFTQRDAVEFTDDTLLNIEDINTELSLINRDFSASRDAAHSRIPLRNLCSQL